MTKEQELVAEANRRWKDKERVVCLPGEFSYPKKINSGHLPTGSDSHYQFNSVGYYGSFEYDEIGDTLCNWGRGLGLLYRKGVWAESRLVPLESPKVIDNYPVY